MCVKSRFLLFILEDKLWMFICFSEIPKLEDASEVPQSLRAGPCASHPTSMETPLNQAAFHRQVEAFGGPVSWRSIDPAHCICVASPGLSNQYIIYIYISNPRILQVC